MPDEYYYEGTTCLVNNLGITDQEELDQAEIDIVTARLLEIDDLFYSKQLTITKETFKSIHKHLFRDLYPFAGEFRTKSIFKQEDILDGASVSYSPWEDIDSGLDEIFKTIGLNAKKKLNPEEFSDWLAHVFSQLWKIHPFREGNTRTLTILMVMLSKEKGYKLNTKSFLDNCDNLRNSLVLASFGGNYDRNLKEIITNSLLNQSIKKECPKVDGMVNHAK